MAFRMYASATSPISARHEDQDSQALFASGKLTSDSTFDIYYGDIPNDHGTINGDGSVTVDFHGLSQSGALVSFGNWRFASAYHGPALNPAPHIDGITPGGVLVNSPEVTVAINGLSFAPASTASIGNTQLNTTYISAQQLRVIVPAVLLTQAGILKLVVTNPGPGGGSYYFSFVVAHPTPTITAITPNTVAAGGVLREITITGTGFDSSTTVTFSGVTRKPIAVASPTSLTVAVYPVDISNGGTIQIAVVNPSPGGGTSATLPLQVTGAGFRVISGMIASAAATVLAGDPVRPVVYAGVNGSDPTHPGSIVALDGASGRALWSVPADAAPTALAISGDGQFLYFSTAADTAIYRVTIATSSISLVTHIVPGTGCSMVSHAIVVSPYDPHTIALERHCSPVATAFLGDVTIYDDTVPRPHIAPITAQGTPQLAFGGSSSVMYGFGAATFLDVALDASGATVSSAVSGAAPAQGPDVLYLNGKLYTTNGVVYDPVARAQLPALPGYLPGVTSIAADAGGHVLYALTSDRQSLAAFDLTRGTFIAEVLIDGPVASRSHLVRWGTDGVAFISQEGVGGGQVYLVRTELKPQ